MAKSFIKKGFQLKTTIVKGTLLGTIVCLSPLLQINNNLSDDVCNKSTETVDSSSYDQHNIYFQDEDSNKSDNDKLSYSFNIPKLLLVNIEIIKIFFKPDFYNIQYYFITQVMPNAP